MSSFEGSFLAGKKEHLQNYSSIGGNPNQVSLLQRLPRWRALLETVCPRPSSQPQQRPVAGPKESNTMRCWVPTKLVLLVLLVLFKLTLEKTVRFFFLTSRIEFGN